MRRAGRQAATAALLVGPAVLAFYSGGYFDGPRAVAAAVAWSLVLLLSLAGPVPLPRSRPGQAAVAGLAGLAAWSAVSMSWAPLEGPAFDSVQRLLLYLAALLAALALLRDRLAARAVEPVLALGALVAIGYGLSGRLVPGIVDLLPERSYAAVGRLEQPITYWNSEGLLAAIGLILCVRLGGDGSRPTPMRVAAVAACAPLIMGVYLSYSRGAIVAAVLGLIVLLAASPTWPQLRAAITGLALGVAASAVSAALPGVASLHGSASEMQRDGAAMLAILVAIMAIGGLVALRTARSERRHGMRTGSLRHARRIPAVAGAAAVLCVAGLIVGGLRESADRLEVKGGGGASRLASVNSVRYEYWRVGLDGFAGDPIRGLGAGGFRVFWLRERSVEAGVKEVHSLPLEAATELGVPGLLLLGLFIGGVVGSARRALRQGAPVAAGACAVCVAWLLHASIDWDWQLPAVTLPAIVLAGALLAEGERRGSRAGVGETGTAPALPEVRPGRPPWRAGGLSALRPGSDDNAPA